MQTFNITTATVVGIKQHQIDAVAPVFMTNQNPINDINETLVLKM